MAKDKKIKTEEIKTEEKTEEKTPEVKTEEIKTEEKTPEVKTEEKPFIVPEAEPNPTTNFKSEDFEEKKEEINPQTKKETRGRKRGGVNKKAAANSNNTNEPNPQAEANKMQIVGAMQMVISALSRIKYKGQNIFEDKPLSKTESETIGEAFNLAYPDFSVNPKISFWLVFGFVIASRKTTAE